MRSVLKLPRVAETSTEVVVAQWLVQVGDQVEVNQPVMQVETDKATVDVPTPIAGVVVELIASVDGELELGDPFMVVDAS